MSSATLELRPAHASIHILDGCVAIVALDSQKSTYRQVRERLLPPA